MSLATNRKATFDYEVLEKISAGLELLGSEVKSLRAGKISLVGSHVIVRGNEAFLMGAEVPPYQPKNVLPDYDPKRPKKLLLTQNELKRLGDADSTKGLTIVPLSVYNKGRFLKIDIAIARGKKRFDKRLSIQKRDVERDLKRSLKK